MENYKKATIQVENYNIDYLTRYFKSKTEDSNFLDQLPPDILLHIFCFLNVDERLRLACVCRSWRDLIHNTPHLWRNSQLKLCCDCECVQWRRTFSSVKRFASHFRELSISCSHHNNHAGCKILAAEFQKLVLCIHDPVLTSLKITDLRLQGSLSKTVSGISEVLTCMLSSLDRLQCFKMSSAQWPLHEGIKVIDTVLTVSRGTLQSLVIDGFFEATSLAQRPAEFDRVTNGILSLNRLTKLGIDYGLLTDEFVTTLSGSHAGQISKLKLVISGLQDYYLPKIAHECWLKLTEACPTMKVAFTLDIWVLDLAQSYVDILDPALPIYKLRLTYGLRFAASFWSCGYPSYKLKYIVKHFRHSLVKLEADTFNEEDRLLCSTLLNHGTMDEAVLHFVTHCYRLLHVKFSALFENPEKVEMAAKKVTQGRLLRDLKKTISNKRRKMKQASGLGTNGSKPPTSKKIKL
ncbi:uncharacterized protein LOC131939010 [Physella acuta]|uniref:uncharacterized protein LOC131939010 n=1 Tax=Physella acuta TaxID=109671 RepID=UPI0027DCAF10|nr:uncharacterized protein LOC131939010 [Physella acuta]